MNETIINNYVNTVSDKDTVFILGDLSIKRGSKHKSAISSILKDLPGSKYLVRGNHDYYSKEFYIEECGFKVVKPMLCRFNMVMVHNPIMFSSDHAGKLLLHGHCHFSKPTDNHLSFLKNEYVYDVGVDANNFTPVSLGHILGVFE
jgi:calcineurin-like phosphoesterase family protein